MEAPPLEPNGKPTGSRSLSLSGTACRISVTVMSYTVDMAFRLRITDRSSIWCVVAFTAYWMWLFCALVAQVFGSYGAGFLGNVWLQSTTVHIASLAVLGMLSRRFSPYSSNPFVIAASPAIMVAGVGILAMAEGGSPSAFVGAACTGVGSAGLGLCWAELFTLLSDRGERRSVLFAGVIASAILYIPLAFAPSFVLDVVMYALPVISMVSVLAGLRGREVPSFEQGDVKEALTLRFALFCLVYSVPLGFFQTKLLAETATGLQSWLPFLIPSITMLTLVALADASAERFRRSNIIPALLMPAAIAGLLLLALFDHGRAQGAGALIFSAQQLLTVVLYARFGAMASRGKAVPAVVFALGICATDVGFVLGMVAGGVAQAGSWALEVTLGIAYVTVLAGFLASRSFDRRADEDPAEYVVPTLSANNRVESVARRYGLTAREEEVLGYLVRGRSIAAIAAEIFLSKNTVRTHVAHLYQKTGVHTRDELMELVEGEEL